MKKQGLLVIEGDATEDKTLLNAGIERASGIIVATARASTTVYVVLSAKVLNPNIDIVARADDENVIEKLKKAGASRIVNPYAIGGLRLANLMINPNVVEFFESSSRTEYESLSIENIKLPHDNFCVGKSLIELDIRKKSGATVIAVIRNKVPIVNPGGKFILGNDDSLLAMGTREQVKNLESYILGK